jgi:hypothetical protein
VNGCTHIRYTDTIFWVCYCVLYMCVFVCTLHTDIYICMYTSHSVYIRMVKLKIGASVFQCHLFSYPVIFLGENGPSNACLLNMQGGSFDLNNLKFKLKKSVCPHFRI